jgi:diaminopimelate decarboxylase
MTNEVLLRAAKEHGTPIYAYSLADITRQYKKLQDAITETRGRAFYAIKANANRDILKHLRKLGAGAETVSGGEVARALEAGFTPENILFTCSNLGKNELLKIAGMGVKINLDSLNQIRWIGEALPGSDVSLRVNNDVGEGRHVHMVTGGALSKFGIHHAELDEARAIAAKHGLRITGLHQHIGSHVMDANIFIGAMRILMDEAHNFPDLDHLDFGGGIGTPYEPHEEEFPMETLKSKLTEEVAAFSKKYGRAPDLYFEPGRYLVAQAGALLVTVTDIKRHSGTVFIGVNSGFNHLIRPTLYGSYHQVDNLSNPEGKPQTVTVAGYVCESGDVFARERIVAEPRIGDVLAIRDAGAYGFSMASDYNLREKPAEVILSE